MINVKGLHTLFALGLCLLLSACGGGNSSSGNGDTARYSINNDTVQCPQADTYEIGGTAISCYWRCAIYKGQKGAVLLHFVKKNNQRWILNDQSVVADPLCDQQ